jgi:hypothetical protein
LRVRAEVAAAVVSVVEVPGLAGLDQLAAAAAADCAGGDEWFELAAAGDVRVGVAACVPAYLALLPRRAHAGTCALGAATRGRSIVSAVIGRAPAAGGRNKPGQSRPSADRENLAAITVQDAWPERLVGRARYCGLELGALLGDLSPQLRRALVARIGRVGPAGSAPTTPLRPHLKGVIQVLHLERP